MIWLTEHFTQAEFTQSDTALRLGYDNDLPAIYFNVAIKTAEMLERLRSRLGGAPILITSGWRCKQLNKAVGSSEMSDHTRALAVDFRAPAFGSPLEICRVIEPLMGSLGIGQLIYEHTWVHVSTRDPDKASNRVLTVSSTGYKPGIVA